jgi:hypothetical protein
MGSGAGGGAIVLYLGRDRCEGARSMTTKRASDFDLRRAVHDPGFTPRARDAEALLDLLTDDGEAARAAERALLRRVDPMMPPWPRPRPEAAPPRVGPAHVPR